jgi:thiosulfate/3-mercaptopyruvate sulfurtransferase
MNGTLYALDLLNTGIGFGAATLIGILFGFFLEQAGFGSSRKLTGVFYLTDMTVMKVMFSAVVTAMVGYAYIVGFGWLNPAEVYMLDTYWGAQIVGGLIFGVGFVMGGWCPGTALVGLASAKWDALVFLVGVVLGSIVFNEAYPLVQPLADGAHAGTLFVSENLRLSGPLAVLLICVGAVLIFAISTALERRAGSTVRPSSWPRRAAAILVLSAIGVSFLPDTRRESVGPTMPRGPVRTASVTAAAPSDLLHDVDAAADHIDPVDLATLVMAGTPGLTVVDLRPASDFAAFHIRGAVSIPLSTLAAKAAGRLPKTGPLVLYSNGTTHAAQAWLVLRMMGWENVRVLTDGILGFWRDCLTPPSLSAAVLDPAAAQQASTGFAERRAFFLE